MLVHMYIEFYVHFCRMEPESILHDHYDVRHRARAMAVKGEVITHLMYCGLLFVIFSASC
jgi:hypothetical protein